MQSQERIEVLLNSATKDIIAREQKRKARYLQNSRKDVASKWRHATQLAVRWSRAHYKDNIGVAGREHMSDVDCFDGGRTRVMQHHKEEGDDEHDHSEEDLAVIHPVVDGRLKDEGRK